MSFRTAFCRPVSVFMSSGIPDMADDLSGRGSGRACGDFAAVFPRKPWLNFRNWSRVCPLSLKSIVNVHNIATVVQVPGAKQTK
eukprot:SAG22_NODE_3092_length_1947_cov_1.851190_2_plen_84_part_00